MTWNILRRFGSDCRGNVAVIFAFSVIPLTLIVGAGIDFGQATRVKSELQQATDVAALAVARDGLGTVTQADLNNLAIKYLNANYHQTPAYVLDKVTLDKSTVTAEVDAHVKVPTTFLKLMGLSSIPVSSNAITKGLGFEIAMVLDTSGSMADSAGSGGSKIQALKDASSALFNVLYGTATSSNRFTIGIIPFASGVNVGAGNAGASWMDTSTTPLNGDHDEDFGTNPKVNRFNLFSGTNGMKNVSWAGCVMTRPTPYDIDDTTPTTTIGNTLFVPWFAPDEPDGDNGSTYNYLNNYLNDEGGSCTGNDAKSTGTYGTDALKQARTCKYKGVTPTTSGGKGPNYLCTSQPITALTSTRATLDSAVTALSANGNTNVLEGFMWGWRVLSPTAPFTEGKAYNAPNNRKVMIVMTDGENNYGGLGGSYYDNPNDSSFFSYGYAVRKNLNNLATNNNNTLNDALDTRTKTACDNAKAKGIIVYAIAFGADADQTLLKYCATDAAHFFAPQNSSDLTPTFISIAQSINALRIAQ